MDDGLGDRGIIGLGTDGVELAKEFLTEEIQSAALRIGRVEIFTEFIKMRVQACKLLTDVAAVGEEGDFPDDAVVIGIEIESGITQALGE